MRAKLLWVIAISAAHAGVVSRDWDTHTLNLQLDDGVAEIEWISSTAFRFSRATTSLAVVPKIKHDPVVLEFEDTRATLKMRGRYMTVEIDKGTAELRISANDKTIAAISIDAQMALHVSPLGKVFGLAGPGDSQRFFFTNGYGIFLRTPRQCTFDLDRGVVRGLAPAMDLMFYYGPSPKEIFEDHQKATGRTEITAQSLHLASGQLPMAVSPLPVEPMD